MQCRERECILATERATKKEARRGVVTRPPPVLPGVLFLRASCGRDDTDARPETAGVKNISETVFEYVVRSTVLFCVHYLKTFVKRLQTIVWEAALHSCVIVICTSMSLSISLTGSNRVFQANDACLQVKLRTQRTGSRSPGAIKCR